jgi:hypothetical protein
MTRGPRLDLPGTFHHVIIREIEKREIVVDDEDRDIFVSRMGLVYNRRCDRHGHLFHNGAVFLSYQRKNGEQNHNSRVTENIDKEIRQGA